MSDPTVEALARQILRLEQTVAGLARARQIERSTVGGAPVRDILDDAIETSDAVSEHDVTLGDMDAESEVDLDNWLEEQEEIHDADDAAHEGHFVGVEALEFANQLQDELAEANLQLEEALREARESLAESGQARGEAAKAVEDAERAAADAAAAIQRALQATGLANTAQDRADSAFGRAADAQAQAEGADLKASEAQSTAQNAQSTADSARQTAEQASADVTSKAAAAESAAKAHADAQAEAARLAAIAAASGDATDKANAAQAAAVAASASDASSKAEAARVAAEAKAAEAKSAADAAKSRADAAHSLAGTASDTAEQAQTTASGKNAILRSTAVPSGTGTSAGDKWERYSTLAAGGKLIGTWAWSGSSWVSTVLDESYLPLVNIGQGTYGDLSGARLVAQSVLADAIAANAVTAVKISANAVTAVKLAANAVTAEKINAGAVATEKLAALAVTAEKLAAGSVLADKIAANAITAAKIAAGAIDGMVITGALIRTAASGRRLEMDGDGLRAIADNGTVVTRLTPDANGLELLSDPASSTQTGARIFLSTRQQPFGSARLQLDGPAYTGSNPQLAASGQARIDVWGAASRAAGTQLSLVANSKFFRVIRTPDATADVHLSDGDSLRFHPPVQFLGLVSFAGDLPYRYITDFGSFAAGWRHFYDTTYDGLQVAIKAGVLYFTGSVEKTSAWNGAETIFTLDRPYWPKAPYQTYARYTVTGNNQSHMIVVMPDGRIITGTASAGSGTTNLRIATSGDYPL